MAGAERRGTARAVWFYDSDAPISRASIAGLNPAHAVDRVHDGARCRPSYTACLDANGLLGGMAVRVAAIPLVGPRRELGQVLEEVARLQWRAFDDAVG